MLFDSIIRPMHYVDVSLAQVERLPDLLYPVEHGIDCVVDSRHFGHATWAANLDAKTVVISWQWAEMRPGIITILDPMTLVSNMRILRLDGVCLNDEITLIHLNNIVYSVRWQTHIRTSTSLVTQH